MYRFYYGICDDVNHTAFRIVPNIYSLDHENPSITFAAFCKSRYYILQMNSMMYRWGLTAACFDRYALTSTDVRFRNLATVRIAYRVIVVIMIIWLLLPIQALVFFDLRGGQCAFAYDVVVSLYFSSYTIITGSGSILPVSIMIVCAILIRRNLALKRQRRRQLRNNEQNNNGHWERIRVDKFLRCFCFRHLFLL